MEAVFFEAETKTHDVFVQRNALSKGILKFDLNEYSCRAHCSAKQLTQCWGTEQLFERVC